MLFLLGAPFSDLVKVFNVFTEPSKERSLRFLGGLFLGVGWLDHGKGSVKVVGRDEVLRPLAEGALKRLQPAAPDCSPNGFRCHWHRLNRAGRLGHC